MTDPDRLCVMSLGAWCRPGHQIRLLTERHAHVDALKGPFDWTVTSFGALRNILSPSFAAEDILSQDHLGVSFAKSGMCTRSELIFHHDISPKELKPLGDLTPDQPLPLTDLSISLVERARGRFQHTYQALTSLRDHAGETLFVRWRRMGHPDHQFPTAFAEETDGALIASLTRFLGHNRLSLLTVESRTIPDLTDPIIDPISEFTVGDKVFRAVIKERRGWNGDQKVDFRGDEHSWAAALDKTIECLR